MNDFEEMQEALTKIQKTLPNKVDVPKVTEQQEVVSPAKGVYKFTVQFDCRDRLNDAQWETIKSDTAEQLGDTGMIDGVIKGGGQAVFIVKLSTEDQIKTLLDLNSNLSQFCSQIVIFDNEKKTSKTRLL